MGSISNLALTLLRDPEQRKVCSASDTATGLKKELPRARPRQFQTHSTQK